MEARHTTSVIIPVFQDAGGIQRCLEALATQTCPPEDFEVVVVDNGSTPPVSILGDYPFALIVIRCESPGSYAARNAGVRASSGRFLAFTDADCIPHAGWLRNGLAILTEAGDDVIVGGEVRLVATGRPSATALYQTIVGFQQRENIRERGFSATANLFCRRPVWDAVGPFNEQLLSGGDREWSWRARSIGAAAVYAPDAVVDTPPRSTLHGAVRQARRVAAGRLHLAGLQAEAMPAHGLQPHRGIWSSTCWILRHPDLRMLERFKVLGVAAAIKAVAALEGVRVRLGGPAERQ